MHNFGTDERSPRSVTPVGTYLKHSQIVFTVNKKQEIEIEISVNQVTLPLLRI